MDFSRRIILVAGVVAFWSVDARPQEIVGGTIIYGTTPAEGPYFFGVLSFSGEAHNAASFGNIDVKMAKDVHPEQKVERGPCGNQ